MSARPVIPLAFQQVIEEVSSVYADELREEHPTWTFEQIVAEWQWGMSDFLDDLLSLSERWAFEESQRLKGGAGYDKYRAQVFEAPRKRAKPGRYDDHPAVEGAGDTQPDLPLTMPGGEQVIVRHPAAIVRRETGWERRQRLNRMRYRVVLSLARACGGPVDAATAQQLSLLLPHVPRSFRDPAAQELTRRASARSAGRDAVTDEVLLSAAMLVLSRWEEVQRKRFGVHAGVWWTPLSRREGAWNEGGSR
jgi:hypothetical protein